jgi:hypothetical protein
MNRRRFRDGLLVLVAYAAGGCSNDDCPRSELVRGYEVAIDTTTACALAGEASRSSHTRQPSPRSCQAACQDTAITDCLLPDSYQYSYNASNPRGNAGSGGAGGACPGAGGETTVVLRCEVQKTVGEWNESCGTSGRRPAGLLPADAFSRPARSLGAYFAGCARLEAASVVAFERLERDLARLGAPRRLRARARKAALDERRHAALAGALAERFGATALPARVEPGERRPSALGLALENAVEGVVRETYGAAEALLRASRAGDEGVRRAMRRIAIDECAHAMLSWDLSAWLASRLDARGKARVRRASRRAVAELGASLASLAPDAAERRLGGAPDAAEAGRLLAALDEALWRRGPRPSAPGAAPRRLNAPPAAALRA